MASTKDKEASGAERRKDTRYSITVPTVLKINGRGWAVEGIFSSSNISISGLCLETEIGLKAEEEIFVDLLLPGMFKTISLLALVKWSKKLSDVPPRFQIGIEFKDITPEARHYIKAFLSKGKLISKCKLTIKKPKDAPNISILELEGYLDASTQKALEYQVEILKKENVQKVVLSFKKTQFINSSCMGVILGLAYSLKAKGGEVRFASVPANINKVIKQTGFDEIFKIATSEQEAIEEFNH